LIRGARDASWECVGKNALLSVVSRISAILACLLALLVTSPLCCCAAEAAGEREAPCCCGDPAGENEKEPCHGCLCASDDPREIPDPAVVPPQGLGISLEAPPASVADLGRLPSVELARPRWTPASPWHAPPAERRARLVSRLL
jgi:hypothetical protein